MDWQLVVVLLVVAFAAVYLLRFSWRTWSARKGSCGGCGCGGKSSSPTDNGHATLIPTEQVTLRRRDEH